MRVQSVIFRDFRNYERFSLEGVGELTVFIGPNAVGKTNILEGIQLLTSASSFRHPQISQLVREGAQRSRIALQAGDGNRELEVALAMEEGKRRYTVNGKAKATTDVRGVLPSVIFTPDDLQLVKRSSSVKRAALDDLGVQLTRNYYIVRRDYEKTVRYKNRLLRDEAPDDLIASINETLVMCGAQLFCLRRALFDRVIPHVARVYSEISGGGPEGFSAWYRPSWERLSGEAGALEAGGGAEASGAEASGGPRAEVSAVRELIGLELEKRLWDERRRGRCLVGPHNDEILFSLAGRDASAFASQGQQRSIVLAWKLAEAEVVRQVLGVSPVLLLDDVLSELDGSRREMLVRFVTSDVQTFVTATDLDGFSPEIVERARVVDLGAAGRGRDGFPGAAHA